MPKITKNAATTSSPAMTTLNHLIINSVNRIGRPIPSEKHSRLGRESHRAASNGTSLPHIHLTYLGSSLLGTDHQSSKSPDELADGIHHRHESRNKDERQQRRYYQAADHCDRHWRAELTACTIG